MPQADLLARATAKILHLDPRDDVGVALEPLAPGARVEANGGSIEVRTDIPYGHKVALRDMTAGETVRKYGWPIGRLSRNVSAGEHVHSHNLATLLSGVEGYAYDPLAPEPLPAPEAPAFLGYRRADGRVATRNEIWILPTVGCVGRTAQKIAAAAAGRHDRQVDGIHAFAHPFGCSQLGEDLDGT
ncbi:MAG: altronate dehydratase, partial [Alphaproteobacteria bacterium]|nr:altronate dehydratase [Alphaproteobacteria bacterium]